MSGHVVINEAKNENRIKIIKEYRDRLGSQVMVPFFQYFESCYLNKDFSNVNFGGMDLHDLDLSGLNLEDARLKGVNLKGGILRRTKLIKVDLTGAILDEVDFSYADLTNAKGLDSYSLSKTKSLSNIICDEQNLQVILSARAFQNERKKWQEENEDLSKQLNNSLKKKEKAKKRFKFLMKLAAYTEHSVLPGLAEEAKVEDRKEEDKYKEPPRDCLILPSELSLEEQPIGKGKFGVVYRGIRNGHTPVAVKKLSDKVRPKQLEEVEKFKREGAVMAQLRHANIVQFYGYCESPDYSLVMEYMERGSLKNKLYGGQISEKLKWDIRYEIMRDIACGLAHLHDKGILHKDLRSANVLIGRGYQAKLADFGLVKIRNCMRNNGSGEYAYAWTAPELLKPSPVYIEATEASDIYSLGKTFWEIAACKRPIEDVSISEEESVEETKAHSEEVVTVPQEFIREEEEIPTDCSPVLAFLIHICRNEEPQERPTAAEIVNYLNLNQEGFKKRGGKINVKVNGSKALSFVPKKITSGFSVGDSKSDDEKGASDGKQETKAEKKGESKSGSFTDPSEGLSLAAQLQMFPPSSDKGKGILKLKETPSLNLLAIRHFKGEDKGSDSKDLRQFNHWYGTQAIESLVFLKPSQSLRCVFHALPSMGEVKEEEGIGKRKVKGRAFENQLRSLQILKNRMNINQGCFIGFEPDEMGSNSHFIFGMMLKDTLVVIDPLGVKPKDFFCQTLSVIRRDLKFNRLYLSRTPLQKDPEGLVSCGTLCTELMLHLSQPEEALLQATLASMPVERQERVLSTKEIFEYHTLDIVGTSLLPSSCQGLLTATPDSYIQQMTQIRQSHLKLLETTSTTESDSYEQSLFNYLTMDSGALLDIERDERFQQVKERFLSSRVVPSSQVSPASAVSFGQTGVGGV